VADADLVTDFTPGTDVIALSRGAFGTALPAGALAPGRFAYGSPSDDVAQVIYDPATGELFYDADGTGSGLARLFAVLEGAPLITAGSFVVVA
jgi:Ca2+-binding RTX toxin-like protein